MPINNKTLADAFNELANNMEAEGDNPYRVRAYRRSARVIKDMPEEITELIKKNYDLTRLPSIGPKIAAQLKAVITANDTSFLKKISPHKPMVNELYNIPGLGNKRIYRLNKILNIHTLAELKTAITKNKLQGVAGFSENMITQIKKQLERPIRKKRNYRLHYVLPIMDTFLARLALLNNVIAAECVGSVRRRKEIVQVLTIVICTDNPAALIKQIHDMSLISKVLLSKKKQLIVQLHAGVRLQLLLTHLKNYAATLLRKTGNAGHYEALKEIAYKRHYELTQDGLYKKDKKIRTPKEATVYQYLNMTYVPPELRENRGEIEAALTNTLPKLITLEDIRGDLHSHTNATDGIETLENMVEAARARGYEYFAITDHSQHLKITNGLDEKRLRQQIERINELNQTLKGITILKAIEVDILEDGQLDLSNEILRELDIRVCSIHSKFRLPLQQQTERVIRAMDNPYFNILAHPTGRLINKRKPYEIDIPKILKAAKERNCFLEINSQPYRLDLNDEYCRMAKELGVKLSISSDAHSPAGLDYMQYGIFQARRGWLSAKDVINTFKLTTLLKLIKR